MTVRKLMILGEIGVGKSSLTRRLVLDRFETDYLPTIGVDVYPYTVPEAVTGSPFAFAVWDTDGNFGDAIFDHVYMKQASAALIVGDLTRPATLEAMARLARGFAAARPGRYFSYVVNKIDLLVPGETPELPSALTQDGTHLVYTSALTGENVKDLFHDAARTIQRRGQ
ncbi:MAG: GTP-binding protein [Paracoccaceae bacterium]